MDSADSQERKAYTLHGLTCANCAARIETALNRLENVSEATINLSTQRLTLTLSEGEREEMAKQIQQIAERIEPGTVVGEGSGEKEAERLPPGRGWRLILGAALFVAALVLPRIVDLHHLPTALSLLGYLVLGAGVLRGAWRSLLARDPFNETLLMSVATLGAIAVGEYLEATAVMLFYALGTFLQERAVDRSRRSIRSLLSLRPEQARVVREGTESMVDPENVRSGELVRILVGERLPVDGRVVEGEGLLDASALTGESLPEPVAPGSEVNSGAVLSDGVITLIASGSYENSTVARILRLAEEATERKARLEEFITRFARYYTPVVFGLALLIAIGGALAQPLLWEAWFYRALLLLVISCPCALVLSIPLGFFAAIGRGSRRGILFKGGNYLEQLAKVGTVVFDKTGTLTTGSFGLEGIHPAPGVSEEELLAVAASLERNSRHPLARAVVAAAQGRSLPTNEATKVRERSGHGVEGEISGSVVRCGTREYIGLEQEPTGIEEETEGLSTVWVSREGELLGLLALADQTRAESAQSIAAVRALGVSRILMLTGDREEVALRVAQSVGIDEIAAQLLPDQKLQRLDEIISESAEPVAVVGDGINDAPMLARADVGIAMGGLGADAAIEAADVIVMNDAPSRLPEAIRLGRRTRKILLQNITLALGIKVGAALLGVLGLLTMWMAVFADVGVTLLAVANTLRLLRREPVERLGGIARSKAKKLDAGAELSG